ncbi:MAG: ADP-glyceromanno-heptose 6-epimerase [Bacteroidetes bacterium]|nr:ADP-glyceromanno-heptose 6-epimerase [Bacteroidota bacterium]
MIIVTGAAGFIASCLVKQLNEIGIDNLILSDDFSSIEKNKNTENARFLQKIHRNELPLWIEKKAQEISFVFHIGARTDTTLFDIATFNALNLHYTQTLWNVCATHQIPFVYASSAATYGMGEYGYDDEDESIIEKLKPLNPYGDSKNDFDKWALKQKSSPPYWVGLKFFNVYGPNEYHKGRMASVIFHAYKQIKQNGDVKLFRSHNPQYADGGQLRDFVYVKDVCSVLLFLLQNKVGNGIYNLGTGTARTFLDLAKNTFKALHLTERIDFIDTPADIRNKYQYFTEAKMKKLIQAGYTKPFHTLEEGVSDYVKNYLLTEKYC